MSSIRPRVYRSRIVRAHFAALLLIAPGALCGQSTATPETTPAQNPAGQTDSTGQPPAPPAPAAAPAKKSSSSRQTSSSSSPSAPSNSQSESSRRFWFGGIAAYTPFKQINGGTTAPAPSTTLMGKLRIASACRRRYLSRRSVQEIFTGPGFNSPAGRLQL